VTRTPQDGSPWDAVHESVLTDLGLPEDLEQLLAAHSQQLDETYQAVAEPVDANTAVSIDADGRVEVAAIKAIEEPESLIELRKRVTAMMPRVDISEAILEVLGWCPQFLDSLTPHLRGPGAPGESGYLGGGVPDRPGVEHHLRSDRGPWRARAGPAPARLCKTHFPAHGELRRDQPAPSHRPGRHRFRAGIGWWAGRGHRRNAICCPGAVRPCPTE
jgi:hypothetical protein